MMMAANRQNGHVSRVSGQSPTQHIQTILWAKVIERVWCLSVTRIPELESWPVMVVVVILFSPLGPGSQVERLLMNFTFRNGEHRTQWWFIVEHYLYGFCILTIVKRHSKLYPCFHLCPIFHSTFEILKLRRVLRSVFFLSLFSVIYTCNHFSLLNIKGNIVSKWSIVSSVRLNGHIQCKFQWSKDRETPVPFGGMFSRSQSERMR